MMTPARRKRETERADVLQKRLNEIKFTEFSVGCEEGQLDACNSLAEWWEFLRNDFAKAASMYGPLCESGLSSSCMNLGTLYAAGRGVDRDPKRAVELWERGCELGSADCCTMAGRGLLGDKTRGLEKDPVRAMELLERGCKLGDENSCSYFASVLLRGGNGVTRNPEQAVPHLQYACERNNSAACKNLALLYRVGDGVTRDLDKADLYLEKALDIYESETGKKAARGIARKSMGMPQDRKGETTASEQNGVVKSIASWTASVFGGKED